MKAAKTVSDLLPCPCCGSATISAPGTFDICDVCQWEDDPAQSADPNYAGGANSDSLSEARNLWKQQHLTDLTHGFGPLRRAFISPMKLQLVLQWPSASLIDLDDIAQAENRLIANLNDGCSVDGHDIGAAEANIFILTNDATATFREVRQILGDDPIWTDIRVGYREITGSN